ncbi:MAG: hypothetical protein QW372_03655 [Nitrososphaerales archaeon]
MSFIARALRVNLHTPDLAFIELIIMNFPPILIGIMLAAIFAAVMSTVDGMALTAVTCWENDFLQEVLTLS